MFTYFMKNDLKVDYTLDECYLLSYQCKLYVMTYKKNKT